MYCIPLTCSPQKSHIFLEIFQAISARIAGHNVVDHLHVWQNQTIILVVAPYSVHVLGAPRCFSIHAKA